MKPRRMGGLPLAAILAALATPEGFGVHTQAPPPPSPTPLPDEVRSKAAADALARAAAKRERKEAAWRARAGGDDTTNEGGAHG